MVVNEITVAEEQFGYTLVHELEMRVPYNLLTLSRSGRALAFAEFGDTSSQNVVFYHHGWPGSRVGGLLTAKHAAELGLRVIAVERPGYGYTPFWNYDMRAWAHSVHELADHLAIPKFSILGVSGGAAFAAACAHFIPGDRVTALGLLCPLGHVDTTITHRVVFWLARHCPRLSQYVWRKLQAAAAADNMYVAKACTSDVDMEVLGRHPEASAILKVSNLDALRQGAHGWCHDAQLLKRAWGFDLRDIALPKVFCWHGLQDRNVPLQSADLYRRIPGCSFQVFPGEGHLSISVRRMRTILLQLRAAVDGHL